jgi:hypothetical protein
MVFGKVADGLQKAASLVASRIAENFLSSGRASAGLFHKA